MTNCIQLKKLLILSIKTLKLRFRGKCYKSFLYHVTTCISFHIFAPLSFINNFLILLNTFESCSSQHLVLLFHTHQICNRYKYYDSINKKLLVLIIKLKSCWSDKMSKLHRLNVCERQNYYNV